MPAVSYLLNFMSRNKNRRDHYLPQGYLRGFIDPARENTPKPLWCFYLHDQRWKERSTKAIGYIDGLYDYADEHIDAEHPDITFKFLENEFPRVRARILGEGFPSWGKHKDFLLRYMQMMRARSPLFFENWREQSKAIRIAKIVELLPNNGVKVDSLEGRPFTNGETQDWTITKMREEIENGSDWMVNFHWALRYTESPSDPVITAEQPVTFIGPKPDIESALTDPDALIYFPICWQAFLFGSIRRFDVETERFYPQTLQAVRRAYFDNGSQFLISTTKAR